MNAARSSSSVATVGLCPRVEPETKQRIWMYRANTCASGRNSRVLASSFTRPVKLEAPLRASPRKLPWVSSQPFGRPVVPEV